METQDVWAEIMATKMPVLLEFYTNWCGPCKIMAPLVQELKQELGKKAKVIQIDVEKNPNLANEIAVLSLPTFIAYNQKERIGQLTGLQTKDSLKKLLKLH